jgi:hypothetical protein
MDGLKNWIESSGNNRTIVLIVLVMLLVLIILSIIGTVTSYKISDDVEYAKSLSQADLNVLKVSSGLTFILWTIISIFWLVVFIIAVTN